MGGDPGVGTFLSILPHLAVPDLPADLRSELEVRAPVVYAEKLLSVADVDALVRPGDHLLQGRFARLKVDLGHADEGGALPAVGAHVAADR